MNLNDAPSTLQHAWRLEGRIDIGFVIGEFDSPRVRNLLVDPNDYVALLPDTHALAARPSLSWPTWPPSPS